MEAFPADTLARWRKHFFLPTVCHLKHSRWCNHAFANIKFGLLSTGRLWWRMWSGTDRTGLPKKAGKANQCNKRGYSADFLNPGSQQEWLFLAAFQEPNHESLMYSSLLMVWWLMCWTASFGCCFEIWRLKRAWTARQEPGAIGRFAAAFDCLADAPRLPLWIRGPFRLQLMHSSLESPDASW